MARSLIRQLEQIRRSATYDDAVSDLYTSAVAEPTISGSLEGDINVVRSLMKELKGSSDWYGDLGNYFDPTNTTAGNAENKDLNLTNLKNNTLDSKTIIIAVTDDNSGSNYTVSGTSTGVLLTKTTTYALPTDRRGLPIFASTANNGTYQDEGASDNVCRVDVLDGSNDQEFSDGTHTIYAKFHDAADFSGTGTGTDVYVRFYKNNAVCDLSNTDVTAVKFVYPHRKIISAMEEYEWARTDFISGWEGDVELVEDISNLWNYTGAADGETDPTWTNTGSYYLLDGTPTDLEAAVNDINDGVGIRNYSEATGYLTDGESVTASIEALNLQIKTNADNISASSGEKYVEAVAIDIAKNTDHDIPSGTYTPSADAGREGKNMDVFVNGQLLAADTGAAGVNADRDYAEVDNNTIKFRFKVAATANITYVVRQ